MEKHYLQQVIEDVNKTHPNLGNLMAITLLTDASKRCLMIVAPSGTGKSQVFDTLLENVQDTYDLKKISETGLNKVQDKLNNFRGTVVIDDLGAVGVSSSGKSMAPYMRIMTVVTLAELNYTHKAGSQTGRESYEIKDFHGGIVMAIQPIALKGLLFADSWESNMADKILRYYHLYRPIDRANKELPTIPPVITGDYREIKCELPFETLQPLYRIGYVQWTRGRVPEHIEALLQGCALLDGRMEVNQSDVDILLRVLRPMIAEQYIIQKDDFEGGKAVDYALMYLMVEWASYGGGFTIEDMMIDYKLSQPGAYKLLEKHRSKWYPEKKNGTIIRPAQSEAGNVVEILNAILGDTWNGKKKQGKKQ